LRSFDTISFSDQTPAMQKDRGYAALVEYGGKRILFDTGNNPDILAQNAKAKGVDLTKLDFVVMSHRHGDHMGGLSPHCMIGSESNTLPPVTAPESQRSQRLRRFLATTTFMRGWAQH
jgi:metal-dependent hydrolase (beta-lactamase superfamily II)